MAVFLKPFHHSSLKDLYPNLFSISTYQRKKTPQLKKKKQKGYLGRKKMTTSDYTPKPYEQIQNLIVILQIPLIHLQLRPIPNSRNNHVSLPDFRNSSNFHVTLNSTSIAGLHTLTCSQAALWGTDLKLPVNSGNMLILVYE